MDGAHHGRVGRADLLLAFAALEQKESNQCEQYEGDEQGLQDRHLQKRKIASLLGFTPRKHTGSAGSDKPTVQVFDTGEDRKPPPRRESRPQLQQPELPSYYYVENPDPEEIEQGASHTPPSIVHPDWLADAKPNFLTETASQIPLVHQRPLQPVPLTPWSRLWPFLKNILGNEDQSRKIDAARLVDMLARGSLIRRLPRKKQHRWTDTARILIDIQPGNFPYRLDFLRLQEQLAGLRGREGLEVQYVVDHPGGEVSWFCNDREMSQQWAMPSRNTPLLILSDLAIQAGSGLEKLYWLVFGQKLKKHGIRPTVLLPVPERNIDRRFLEYFDCVVWDRAGRLRPVPGELQRSDGDDQQDNDDKTATLLALLFPALRVDLTLLRRIRGLLPAEYDVGHEAAVRHHADMLYAGDDWGWINTEKSKYLESFLQVFRGLSGGVQQRYLEILGRHHAAFADELYFEAMQELDRHGVTLPVEVRKATDAFWANLVKTYLENGEDAGLASWVKRYLARHEHPTMHQQHNQYQVALYVCDAQRNNPPDSVKEYPSSITPEEILLYSGELQQPVQNVFLLCQHGMGQLRLVSEALHKKYGSDWGRAYVLSRVTPDDNHVLYRYRDARGQVRQQRYRLENESPLSLQVAEGSEHELIIARKHTNKRAQSLQTTRIRISPWMLQDKPDWAVFRGVEDGCLYLESENGQGKYNRWYYHPPETGLRGFWYDVKPEIEGNNTPRLPVPTWATTANRDQYGLYADMNIFGVTQRFRWIEPTSFLMGSPKDEPERYDNETQHQVILNKGYWLAETTCTQQLWQVVMGENPSAFNGEESPVDSVSWEDAQRFCNAVNINNPELRLRLPTEAEWENGCRAGTTGPFWFGEQIDSDFVNYDGKEPYNGGSKGQYRQQTVPVKELACNGWGLYQMHGNVWEWCLDWFGDYKKKTAVNPAGAAEGGSRVLRGGSWFSGGGGCRAAYRSGDRHPSRRNHSIGFRLARGHEPGTVRQGAVLRSDENKEIYFDLAQPFSIKGKK